METADETEKLSPESIARRHASARNGYRLATYVRVGLPIYKLTLSCVVLAIKDLAPIDEFILRTVAQGLVTIEQISGFLGLEENIVRQGLVNLQRSEDVYYYSDGAVLTTRGKSRLADAKSIVPKDRNIEVFFDGLLRRCCPINVPSLVSTRLCTNLGLEEIPPSRSSQPDIAELSVDNVGRHMKRGLGSREKLVNLIQIRQVLSRERLHLPALSLIYKQNQGDGVQIAFCIDGRPSREHEEAFAVSKSAKRLQIEKEAKHPPDSLVQMSGLDSEELAKSDASQPKSAPTPHHTQKFLDCYEHPYYRGKALRESKGRLLIISPWITTEVVDRQFLKELEGLLASGVRVVIGYGIKEKKPKAVDARDAEELLSRLAKKYKSNFSFVNHGNTHAKVLISDSRFAIFGSFNWLSFKGHRGRTFRDEQGVLLSEPRKVEEAFQLQLKLLELSK